MTRIQRYNDGPRMKLVNRKSPRNDGPSPSMSARDYGSTTWHKHVTEMSPSSHIQFVLGNEGAFYCRSLAVNPFLLVSNFNLPFFASDGPPKPGIRCAVRTTKTKMIRTPPRTAPQRPDSVQSGKTDAWQMLSMGKVMRYAKNVRGGATREGGVLPPRIQRLHAVR